MDEKREEMNMVSSEMQEQAGLACYQEKRVREICRYLTEHLDRRMTQAEIAKKFRISLTALKLTFQRLYGMPIETYLRKRRILEAKRLLRETQLPVSEIAHRVGYDSHSQFSAMFRTSEGQSPTMYRQNSDTRDLSNSNRGKTKSNSK